MLSYTVVAGFNPAYIVQFCAERSHPDTANFNIVTRAHTSFPRCSYHVRIVGNPLHICVSCVKTMGWAISRGGVCCWKGGRNLDFGGYGPWVISQNNPGYSNKRMPSKRDIICR